MTDEGSIKFDCRWQPGEALLPSPVPELIASRDRLFDLGLVGALPDGIGYGNVSVRLDRTRFLVTGSGSGGIARLRPEHLAIVTSVDFTANRVDCTGPVMASSESMTHAALYHADLRIAAVVHVHSHALWSSLLDVLPTSHADVPYGTPAMAREIARLLDEERPDRSGVIVMGGHRDGLIGFGESLDRAEALLVERLRTIER